MSSIRSLILDYVNLIKETIDIYISENRKIFSCDMTGNFDTIQKYYEEVSKENLEVQCSPWKILSTPDLLKSFNEVFISYQSTLLIYGVVKNDVIYSDDKFKIESYNTMDEFINFLLHMNPKPEQFEEECKNLIQFSIELKRDPGIFKSWKNCVLLISKQNNVILFDESVSYDKFLNYLNLKKLKFKLKEDKKNPFRFEIVESKKGVMFNSNVNFILDGLTKEKFEEIMKWIGDNIYVQTEESTKRDLVVAVAPKSDEKIVSEEDQNGKLP
jgi:hypothetical protein